MPRGLSAFIEFLVLAAGANTLLRRRGARILAPLRTQKDVLKLIHAGVREEQRRIVGGQEWRRAHARVPVLLKIPQKSFANFVTSHHPIEFTSSVSSVVNERIFSLTNSKSHPCRRR